MIWGCQILLCKVYMPLNLNLFLDFGVKFNMNESVMAVRVGAIVKIAMKVKDF